MIRRRSLRTRAIKMLVLDEADEMLNKGEGMATGSLDGRQHLQLGSAHHSVVLYRV